MLIAAALRLARAVAMLLFGAGLIQHAIARFELPTRLLNFTVAPQTALLTSCVLAATALALVLPLVRRAPDRMTRVVAILGLVALVLVVPFTFLAANFGYVDFETVMMSMADNRASDIVDVAVKDFAGPLAETALTTLLLAGSAWWLMRRMPAFVPVLGAIALFAIVTSQPAAALYRLIFPDPALKMVSGKDLVAPEVVSVPATKRNLVIIYLESLERSYRDIPASADAFGPLAAFEDRGFSARNLAQIHGTHYSAAGLVASQCGIPLLPRGLTDPKSFASSAGLAQHGISRFLPGVTCLGDLLAAQGYQSAYVNGSDTEIFAIGNFLKDHGIGTVRGLRTEPEFANVEGTNTWGVPDTVLFDVGLQELDRLAAGDAPFALMLFTASTHGPGGYLDPGCDYTPPVKPRRADSLMPATIYCTGKLIEKFLSDLAQRGLAENTVVVLMSDHLAMPNTMGKELTNLGEERRNYFVVLDGDGNSDGVRSDRPAIMPDIYPTIVESLGFKLKNGAGNLGRSLLSTDSTLSERLGHDIVNRALFGNPELRRLVWTDQ